MSEKETVLQPGVAIKPAVNKNYVKEVLSEVYGLKCLSVNELNGYDDSNYHVIVEADYDNEFIGSVNPSGYTFKVINTLDSKKPQFFEAQDEVLIHLGKEGLCCPQPVKNKKGQYYIIKEFSSGKHLVRLLEFIEGSILHKVPCTKNLFYQCGKYVAQLDEALKSFHHPAFQERKTIWHLDAVPQLSDFVFVIKEESRKKMVKDVIEQFSKRVLDVSQKLEKGMIHADFNEQNILVEKKDDSWLVKGVLDFGDCHVGCYIYELAITMTYMMIQGKSVEIGGHVLAGYSSIREVPTEEFNLLKVCIMSRLIQSLVLGAYSSLQDPDNSYLLVTSKSGWTLLEHLWNEPEKNTLEKWKNIDSL